jgi:rhamnogalacturonyl hydrolase YesR
MKSILRVMVVLVPLLLTAQTARADEFAPDSIKSIMRKVAKYAFTTYGAGTAAGINHDWDGGTIMTGITGLYLTTKEQQWLDSIDKWGNKWNWTWGGGTGDNLCCIQTFCERYIVDSVPANASKYAVSKTALDGILKSPVNHLFGWQDAVYMGLPDFAMMGYITGNPMYYDSLNAMFRGAEKDFQDTVYKLWYWNTLPSFKTTPKGYPQFWGPGNAWVLGGLVRSLKYMPQNSKYRPAWEATFKTFCDTLRIKQQPDGFWRTSLFEPTEFPNPESSCTSFFIYAMSLGVQWGILDANTFVPVIRKGWSALVKVVTAAGMVGYGQSWSNQPGSPYNWTAIPEGHGAFLLAGEGVSIIVGLPTGSLPLPSQTRVSRTPVWGIGTLMIVSGGRKTVRVAAGSNGLEVYDARGARLWRCDASGGADISLPERIARGGVYYVKFLK